MTDFPNLGFAGNSLPRREEGHFPLLVLEADDEAVGLQVGREHDRRGEAEVLQLHLAALDLPRDRIGLHPAGRHFPGRGRVGHTGDRHDEFRGGGLSGDELRPVSQPHGHHKDSVGAAKHRRHDLGPRGVDPLRGRRANEQRLEEAPLVWLYALGMLFLFGTLLAFATLQDQNIDKPYEPAIYKDGKIQQGSPK